MEPARAPATQPDFHTVDLRLRYPCELPRGGVVDFYADVYNFFDNQDTLLIEEGYIHPDVWRYASCTGAAEV